MNIYIGFTLSPKSHAKNRLVAVLNYLSGRKVEMINYFLPKKDQPIQMAYITIMAIITPIVILLKQIPQYCIQVINQVKHEAGKKHHRQTTYNDLNIRILNIIIPCIYLIPHLLQKFIYGILGITRVSKGCNHPMNDVPYAHVILALNRLQMLLILNGGTK